MSEQPPGTIGVELAKHGVRIVAKLQDGRKGSVVIPVHLAEELAEGIIRLVREFERRRYEELGWM